MGMLNKLSAWEMNDLKAMIENHGLKTVVEALSAICMQEANSIPITNPLARSGWEIASSQFAKLNVPLTLRR
jgi:hypothetical protein